MTADHDLPLILSPKAYVSHPGFRIQLILTRSTYSDNSYLGVFFRLVTGVYDPVLAWPYQYRTDILVNDFSTGFSKSHTVIPNRDACRFQSAFLRPSTDTDNSLQPDGCGSRRLISMDFLSNYLRNGSLMITSRIYLNEVGQSYETANLTVLNNHMSSEYVWTIPNFSRIQNESITSSAVAVLSSPPYYTNAEGYLMQMFLTLLPTKMAFAISFSFSRGDYDR